MSLLRRRVMGDDKIDWEIEVTEISVGSGGYRGYPHRKVGDTWIINPKSSYMPLDSCMGSSASAGIEFWINITPHIPCPIKIWIEGMEYAVICTSGYPISTSPMLYSGESNGRDITWNYEQEADSLSCNFATWNGTTSNADIVMSENSAVVTPNAFIHIDFKDGSERSEVIKICKMDWYIAIEEFRHYFTYDASLVAYTGYNWLQNVNLTWHDHLRDPNDTSLYGSQTESPLTSYTDYPAKGVPEFLLEEEMSSATIINRYKFKDRAPILAKRYVFSNSQRLGIGNYSATWVPYPGVEDASLYHSMYVNSCFAFKVITNCCRFDMINVFGKIARSSLGGNSSQTNNSGTEENLRARPEWGSGSTATHCFYSRGWITAAGTTGGDVGKTNQGTLNDPSTMVDELGNHCEATVWVVYKGHTATASDFSNGIDSSIVFRGMRGVGSSSSYFVKSNITGIKIWPWAMYKIQSSWMFPRGSLSYYANAFNNNSGTLQYYEINYMDASGATGGTYNPSLMELPGGDLTNRYYIGDLNHGSSCPNKGSSGVYYQIVGTDLVGPFDGTTINIDDHLEHRTNLLYKKGNSSRPMTYMAFGIISLVAIKYYGTSTTNHKFWRIGTVWGMDNGGSNSAHSRNSTFTTTSVAANNGSIGLSTRWLYTLQSTSTNAAWTWNATVKSIGSGTSYVAHYLRPQSFVINTLWEYPTW